MAVFSVPFFFWMKSILHYEEFRDKKFSVNNIFEEYRDLAGKIVDAFCKIPTTEIWNIETVNSTLRQIRFYRGANSFASAADADILYDKVEKLMGHIEKQAEGGVKFKMGEKPLPDAAPFILMNNELILNTFFCSWMLFGQPTSITGSYIL